MRSVHSRTPSVLISSSIASKLPAAFRLQAGNRSLRVQAQIEPDEGSSDSVHLLEVSPAVSRAIAIPAYSYRILRQDESSIRIGPVVAVLIASKPSETTTNSTKSRRLYKQLILQGWKRGIFIYCFFPQDVFWGRGLIHGHTYTPNGKWISGNFPIPDVVYNRILYRSTENQRMVQKLLEGFDNHPGVYLFNRRFLNKWEVFKVLAQDPMARYWLPETTLFSGTSLQSLIHRHKDLFLKPCHSSKGQGILKVERVDGRGFRYGRTEWKGKNWIYVPNLRRLSMRLRQSVDYPRRYILQQGIDLARLNGRIFDLRAQAQKNRQGEWVLTGVGVRVAARNRFVTHVPNGGSRANFYTVIKEVFPTSKTQHSIEQELHKICRIVPAVLEEGLQIPLGVLSMDIGVDSSGKLWILEVNSKPARFDEADIRHRHMELLIDYFIFAAEHNSKGR